MKNKKIVITGASGRLGTVLSEHFSSLLFSVQQVSRQAQDGFISYEELCSDAVLQQTDVIFHLAWSSVPKVSEDNFGQEWGEDIPLLVKLLQAIRSGGHNHIHFIFFSSAGAIYGLHGGQLSREDSKCSPANMYGWAKLHAEQLLQQYSQRFPLAVTILRITNVYGINSRIGDQQGVIPYLIRAALSGNEMCIWGDGTAQKDYIHVTDLLAAIDSILLDQVTGLFNLSYGMTHSLHDIIHDIERITGRKIQRRYTEHYPWDNAQVAVDNNKIKKIVVEANC